jgi:multiple sugar transport system ATP-binding protein
VILRLRPEHLGRASAAAPRAGHVRIPAAIDLVQPTGSRTYITILLGGVPVTAEVEPHEVGQAGEAIEIELDMNKAVLIDPATDKVI